MLSICFLMRKRGVNGKNMGESELKIFKSDGNMTDTCPANMSYE